MSAFSRGFQFTAKNVHGLLTAKSCQAPRGFASSSILQAAKHARASQPTRNAIPNKPSAASPGKGSSILSASNVYKDYASTLAEKRQATLLYQAPSHTTYMLACYGTAGFCFTYAAISFWSNYMHAPPDISPWVPIAFGGVSFLMAALGGWLCLGPARLVRSISAIPRSVSVAQGTAVSASSVPKLQIEFELKKMLPVPFLPARKIYARPSEVELPFRFVPVNRRVGVEAQRRQEETLAQGMEEEEGLHKTRKKNRVVLLFQRAGTAFSMGSFSMFVAMKRIWTRDGMMVIDVKGQRYQVDISSGWALDGGKALDRLAKIKVELPDL